MDKSIQKYLLSIEDIKEHNYFTERKLRSIAVVKDRSEQIRRSGKLVDNIRFEFNGELE